MYMCDIHICDIYIYVCIYTTPPTGTENDQHIVPHVPCFDRLCKVQDGFVSECNHSVIRLAFVCGQIGLFHEVKPVKELARDLQWGVDYMWSPVEKV